MGADCRLNEVIQADGGSYGIQWTPDSSDAVVWIALINETAPVSTIASQISNNGMFVWNVPRSLTAGRYTIAIVGGAAGASPTDYTSSGEFVVTGPFALNSSIASMSAASSSVPSSLEAQLSSIFQVKNSSAVGNMTAAASATSTSGGGVIVGPSATAAPSSSASATGTSGTEPLVRHADFAVIIFAFVCVLMQI